MTTLKNEQRIIRVTGCNDCPYDRDRHCELLIVEGEDDRIHKYVTDKTLPDNCPLEKIEEVNERI